MAKDRIQSLREDIDWIERIPASGSGMSPMEIEGYRAALPSLRKELYLLEAEPTDLPEEEDSESEPGDASVRGETSDGRCAFCGKPVGSPQCCVNPR